MTPDDIKILRQKLQLTQEDFAHKIGISVQMVSKWENGHCKPNRLSTKYLKSLSRKVK